jgi:hypothetical protein
MEVLKRWVGHLELLRGDVSRPPLRERLSKVPEDVWRWLAGQPMSAQVWSFPRRILVLRALLRQLLYQHLASGLGLHG